MPDKLTDSEIIKALKEILEIMLVMGDLQKASTISKALDLINLFEARIGVYETCNARKDEAIKYLEAENERLKKENHWFADIGKLYSEIKAEAYKECIEKVKALFPSDNEPYQYWEIHEGADNLLKELVGEGGGNK